MDYIQEELRRQRAALAGLLLGGTPRRSEGDHGDGGGAPPPPRSSGGQPEAVPAGAAALSKGRRALFPAEGGGESPRSQAGGLTAPEAEALWRSASAGEGFSVKPGRRGSVRLEEAALSALAGGGTEAPGLPGPQGSAGGAVPERTAAEFLPVESGGGSVGAEALSRAFQRDARRYDGGFSLY